MFNQAKVVMQMQKLKKELSRQIIEVSAGEGAVTVTINGEQKIKKISIDPERIDLDDIGELEEWVATAVKEAITKSQEVAAEKMRPIMGDLGKLGL